MEKRKNSDRRAVHGKKQRKSLTLEEKLDVIKRYERNERNVDIVRVTGISESTLRTIRNQDEKIKESCKGAMRMTASKITQIIPPIMEKLERMLAQWIEHQNQQAVPISTIIIQAKAKTLFENQNAVEPDPKVQTFAASAGWFERFKRRHGFHNLKLIGDAAAADLFPAENFPAQLQAAIEEHCYLPQQVFNLDETGLFWKRMPSRTFISAQEKTAPGFKSSKDRLTLLLGGKASGDYKTKPLMVYRSENQRALKAYSKEHLPVVWLSNTTGWTTGVQSLTGAGNFSSSPCVQTGSGAHPASYPIGTGGPFPGVKRSRGVTLATHPHLVPRLSMSRSNTSSPPLCLHGMQRDSFTLLTFTLWRSNRKAWITTAVFESYFSNELSRELKAYCERINVPFRILILLDNAPGHPASIADVDENINVMFLPPNTSSLIQPMDQGVTATFKSYYLRRTFIQMVKDTVGEDKIYVKDFSKRTLTLKKRLTTLEMHGQKFHSLA
jgi:hypothetical protein